jgi:hypothetical protein
MTEDPSLSGPGIDDQQQADEQDEDQHSVELSPEEGRLTVEDLQKGIDIDDAEDDDDDPKQTQQNQKGAQSANSRGAGRVGQVNPSQSSFGRNEP